jgi:guanine deaminase
MIIHGLLLIDPASPPTRGWLRVEGGTIAELREGEPPSAADGRVIGGATRIITPAFVDAHTHLPQFVAVGCDGMDLLEWLDRVVYPAEIWWGRGQALSVTRHAVARFLAEGTGAVAAYLTSHGEINRECLAHLQSRTPLRFIAGRVAMDRSAPDELTAEDRERVALASPPSPVLPLPGRDDGSGRHRVSTNPRFAIACTEELMAEIGWLLRERPELFVQTHLAETAAEVARVRELFPDDPSYTAVYDRFGLLGPRTLLAHGVHLTSDEWDLIRERGSVVVHCPGANTFLRSGMFDLAAAHEHGVRLALGSDVAAGPDVAMPRVARAMIEVAKLRAMSLGAGEARVPGPAEAWRLITEGGADALGWPNAGRIAPGADADLLVLRVPDGWRDEHLVGRILYGWSPDLIESRVLGGAEIDAATIGPGC